MLPPGYKGTVPRGYFVYHSGNNVFIFLRGFYRVPKNLTPALTHLEWMKSYPLNGEAGAKPMKIPDASGVPVNMLPISDCSAFEQLKLLVDREGDDLGGPDGLGMMSAIGIVKGRPFMPDAHTKGDPRSGRENCLQDESRRRLRRSGRRPLLSDLSRPSLGQSFRRRDASEAIRCRQSVLAKQAGG